MIENYGRHCCYIVAIISELLHLRFGNTAEIRLWLSRTRLVLKVHPPATAGDPAATQDTKNMLKQNDEKMMRNHQILGVLKPRRCEEDISAHSDSTIL